MDTPEQKVEQVSRAGSRFALIMFFAAAIMGIALTAMSAVQLRQVSGFSRQLLGMRARSAAMSFFLRYVRQPARGSDRIPGIVDEAALGAADYIQVIDVGGEILGSYAGEDAGDLPDADVVDLRDACSRGFRQLDGSLPWRDDGTIRMGRGMMGAMVVPARMEMIDVGGHPVLDATFALPGPDLLKRCGQENDMARMVKCKGMLLARDDLLAGDAPCMVVRVGVDATAHRRTVRTHWGILALAILTTLIILAINLVLYRTLKQRERMAANLQRARRIESLGEMAATLAHELKNPVGAIRGYAQLMREAHASGQLAAGDPDAERMDRAVETIVRESQRLEELVRRTLEFARPGDLDLSRFDLREVADAAATLLAAKAGERGVTIITDHEGSAVTVEADRGRIEQVVANLLDNALEASPSGGNVALAVTSGSEGAVIEVRDRGRGIEPERLEEIFKPFSTTKENGTGLGLAVSRSIVEAHSGSIRVQSEGAGKGTTVRVTLPHRG